MTNTDSARDFTSMAVQADGRNDLNLPPVAEVIINKGSRDQASRAGAARNANGRRRFVDPTTCDRDYNQAEMEFMKAMQVYQQASGRMFPTWSEILEVLKGLGNEKVGLDSD